MSLPSWLGIINVSSTKKPPSTTSHSHLGNVAQKWGPFAIWDCHPMALTLSAPSQAAWTSGQPWEPKERKVERRVERWEPHYSSNASKGKAGFFKAGKTLWVTVWRGHGRKPGKLDQWLDGGYTSSRTSTQDCLFWGKARVRSLMKLALHLGVFVLVWFGFCLFVLIVPKTLLELHSSVKKH